MASLARSGWGIRPATLRASLQMPAMFHSEPLGLAGRSVRLPRWRIARGFGRCLEFFQGGVVGEITALAVGNGKPQEFALGNFVR